MSDTATARLQPIYPARISIQAAITNPVVQKIFLTTFVDNLLGDRIQSANQPTGTIKSIAKNNTDENTPLFVILNPKTSCMKTGTQVIIILKPQLKTKNATLNAQTGREMRIFRHGVVGRATSSVVPIIFFQYSRSVVDIRG